jgi:hypothetical protein
MAEDKNDLLTLRAQPIEAVTDQFSPYTSALELWDHRDGSQSCRWYRLSGCLDRDSAKENVTDDLAFGFGDEGSEHDSLGAQPIYEIGLVGPIECLFVDEADRCAVFGAFRADDHGSRLFGKLRGVPAAAQGAD